MKKYLLSFILSVAALASTHADGYTGVLVTNGDQKSCYLFEEQPTVKYKNIDGMMSACFYVAGQEDPVVVVPVQTGAKLSAKFNKFVRVTLNSEGYATFSAGDASFVVNEGVTAYKAAVNGELITLTALEGNIPAGTGVMLYGETPNTKVDLSVATSGTNADVTNNSLKPTTLADGSLATMEANSWALGDGTEFLRYTNYFGFVHNRAYIVHEQSAGAKSMQMVFADGEATSIDNVVNKASVREGKFIENGKVVIIKNGMKYNVAGQAIK